jgi:hypothetical protein
MEEVPQGLKPPGENRDCNDPQLLITITGVRFDVSGEQTMLNDFLPAIISVGVLAGAFLLVRSSDARKSRRIEVMEPNAEPIIESEGGEQLSMSTE